MDLRLVILYFLSLSTCHLSAQKINTTVSFRDIDSNSYFRFNYDNDYFAATDENYTQGYNLELALPIFSKNPVNFLFLKPEDGAYKYGLSIEHIGFTPNDYVSPEIQIGDRPFASAIMLRSFVIATDTIRKYRLSQSLSLGIIGPGAFGKEMQVAIHEATGNKIPRGWRNQIRNDVIINYRLDFEQLLLHHAEFFEVNATSSLQIGTLFTNASIGASLTVGLLDSPFSINKSKSNFNLYFYSQPILTAVGYDATLQGGLFNTSSPYTISNTNIERFTAQFNYGLILKTKTLFFEYSRSAITREFNTGSSAKWGGIKIGFTF